MAEAARSPAEIISLPQGGGAMHGLGETFTADVHSGTDHMTLPLTVHQGRGGFGPQLRLAYSTGSGNGRFGLGWQIALPSVSRLTAPGVPRYQDGRNIFVLSGAEDLVPVGTLDGAAAHRPRTKAAFARILHRTGPGGDHGEVTATAGLTRCDGTPRPAGAAPDWSDPATVADPDDRRRIFGWMLTETRDPLGNRIVYRYDTDEGAEPGHRWSVPLLREIAYADWTDAAGAQRFTATIASPLTKITISGHDGQGHEQLPPLESGYTDWQPVDGARRRTAGVLPTRARLGPCGPLRRRPTLHLPAERVRSLVRNRGQGAFDPPRAFGAVPAGAAPGSPGVELADMNGDGRPVVSYSGRGPAW